MPITEEQRQRAETNRLAALAKRKALVHSHPHLNHQQPNPWSLFKCRKLSSSSSTKASGTHFPSTLPRTERFRARLEISSPDSFSITPLPVKGFLFPGEAECFTRLLDCLSLVMPSHFTQNHGGGKACVYKLRDYDAILMCLKTHSGIEVEKIPFGTLNVIRRLSHSFEMGRWEPCRPEHLTDEEVDVLIGKLPRRLLDVLLPFQFDGLRFGLQRGGRCLIADEMGLGKTLQAIAVAGCYIDEGPLLVVCPAILRYSWAEELERWMPFSSPSDIHLVFGRHNNPAYLTKFPRVVVISYTMLQHLKGSMLEQDWGILIIDESQHLRCSKKKSEPKEIKALLDVAAKVKRIILLSGTPSLSRPGLLGQTKYDFAKTYCDVRFVRTSEGKGFQDFSKGVRLLELNMLLRQTVMIRRLKEHVLEQLPPKRRQIIRLLLKKSDITSAKAAIGVLNCEVPESSDAKTANLASSNRTDDVSGACCQSRKLSYQEVGVAKLSGFREWFMIHPLILEADGIAELETSQKMIIFAHHHKVLDGVQELICEKGIGFVRIDGNTLPRDRQSAVLLFQTSIEVKIAIIGITAGGVGLDFSAAQNVVFLELPQCPSLMLQAEDRAHRRGQTSAVNVYIFCAQDTLDETLWRTLNKSLHRVSSTTNGKYDAVPEIQVDGVSYLQTAFESEGTFQEQILVEAQVGEHSAEKILELPISVSRQDAQAETQDKLSGSFIHRSHKKGDSAFLPVNMDDLNSEKIKDSSPSVVLNLEIDNCSNHIGTLEKFDHATDARNQATASSLKIDEGNEDEQIQKESHKTMNKDDSGFLQKYEPDKYCSNDVYSMRFEVSKYTGRIHLYSCIPERDSRPQPLYESFRPEELESLSDAVNNNNDATLRQFKINKAYKEALLAFNDEWNKLRPIERRKLLGKTLQLPLNLELCYLNENINHDNAGLLKGGSKRRITPWHEISHPLPSNAVWKKVHLSSNDSKKERQYTQGWTLMEEALCKLCQKPCMGSMAKKPEYFEDLFCGFKCYEEYRIRTSNRSLRQELFKIEHGICVICQLDCHLLVKTIKPLSLERRREYVGKMAPKVASKKKMIDKLVNNPSEGNAWHADHIIPVYRGGGECRLENMRTLCVACHFDVTAAQRTERRLARAKAKKHLEATLNYLKYDQSGEGNDTKCKGQGLSPKEVDLVDELLVRVPGSAYSVAEDTGFPAVENLIQSAVVEN